MSNNINDCHVIMDTREVAVYKMKKNNKIPKCA